MEPIIINLNIGCGLCNRLKTIFYFYNNIRLPKQEMIVIWKSKNNDAMGGFYDLFTAVEYLKFVRHDIKPIHYTGNGSDLPLEICYSGLDVLPHIKEKMTQETDRLGDNYIAIHVRRTDIDAVYRKLKVPYDTSYDTYCSFIENNPSKNLYIATDNEKTYKFFYDKYKNSRIVNTNITFNKNRYRRETSIQDSVIDLFMCTKAFDFMGTNMSTFTEFIILNRQNSS